MIGGLSTILDKLINIIIIKLTKLSAPQLAILLRSSMREDIVSTLNASLELIEGFRGNIVEKCKVKSSVYE